MRKPDLQRIGNYRVIQEIGSGGFARVYLGVHDYLETKAAIKVLRMNQGLTSEEKRNFLIEARTIARLRHPHIVRILDFNVEHNMPYLVMEYAPAGSLSTLYPAKSVLQLRTILSYTKQVAAALQFAHERHIVHCDVKPENMLVSEQNTILLSDFGIAVVFNSNLRTQDVAVGTMYYMAPEQYKGRPEPASDQYSLAVVVYLWLCGQLPFKGKNAIEMYHLHATVPPCPPREINPRISRDVERVVLTALAKRPEQRFPDVQTFARALEKALLEPKQVAKAPAARLSPAGKNEDRTPRIAEPQLEALLPAPSSILPVATPAMPVLSTPIQDAPHAPLPPGQLVLPGEQFDAPSQEVTLRADIALPPTETALPPEDHDAPIVSSIAYPSMNVSASQPPLTLGQRILFTHSDHANWVLALAWSPNGHAIASGSWDTTVQVWGVATGMLLTRRSLGRHAPATAPA